MKPTIGIIGGSGPLATVDIEQKILLANKKLASVFTDQDYFNLVVLNNCGTHDRNDSVFLGKPDPLKQYIHYISSITTLGVDLILLACNTAHMYLPVLKEKTHIPIISIIETVLTYFSRNFQSCSKVGLISTKATSEKGLYHNVFHENEIDIIDISPSTQSLIMEAIYLIKSGVHLDHQSDFISNSSLNSKVSAEQIAFLKNHPHKYILTQEKIPNPVAIINEAVKELMKKGSQHIIFGCTELPLALPYLVKHAKIHYIDPNAVVAEAIVEYLINIENNLLSNLKVANNNRK